MAIVSCMLSLLLWLFSIFVAHQRCYIHHLVLVGQVVSFLLLTKVTDIAVLYHVMLERNELTDSRQRAAIIKPGSSG